ncbi:hypothetical protein [Deinococcus sp.]|uniref:hypothetical protein n=1 Tax=Deinococcus sp. TaxID=47478 RepID=UPI0025F114A9|nr:hypothetical protein [Deinococcus sp.]
MGGGSPGQSGIRASTEALTEALQRGLPADAGPVAIERALTKLEPEYLRAVAQQLIDAAEGKKKDIQTGR